ncbi:molybdopterin converting factor subunit 1 [Terrarubrum flagellatum]|uniref:molybdopterin converting factor subunit 1 n=1 Tax=Terrirubrum flagellatum TaxID=2895980 RepID=UPI0031451C97
MRVNYFSWLRTKTGVSREDVALPQGGATVADLVTHLAGKHPALGEIANTPGALRCVVNRRYVENSHSLAETDEVQFFPPVTGG